MTKIVVLGAKLKEDQKARLEALGKVEYLLSPTSSEELLGKAEDVDVLCVP